MNNKLMFNNFSYSVYSLTYLHGVFEKNVYESRSVRGGGAVAVVNAASLERRRSQVRISLWPLSFKVTKVPSTLSRKDLILWGASLTER